MTNLIGESVRHSVSKEVGVVRAVSFGSFNESECFWLLVQVGPRLFSWPSDYIEPTNVERGAERRVLELAIRWCNRPLSVARDWLANDREMFTKLHEAVGWLGKESAKEPSNG